MVARLAIDRLRRRSGAEPDWEPARSLPVESAGDDPAVDVELVDSVNEALLIVLDTLRPAERLAFVLHDMFAVPFEQIAQVLDRSPAAAKQLASRARGKVQGVDREPDLDPRRRRSVVDAFLDASRNGNFEALVSLLHPDIALIADDAAVAMGSPGRVRGATDVATLFSGRALAARAVDIDGLTGIAWLVDGRPRVVWEFVIVDGVPTQIDMIADPATIDGLDIQPLERDDGDGGRISAP